MDVHLITASGVTDHPAEELDRLMADGEGFVWVDVPEWDAEIEQRLGRVFGFHPLAMRECAQRTRVPKVHVYADHVFFVLHAPQMGRLGHVHYVELDRFVGNRYLVTVHGPNNPEVPIEAVRRDVEAVLARLRSGHLQPTSAFDISHAVITSMARSMERFLEDLTTQVWSLEQEVTLGSDGDHQEFLDRLFRVRHGLLAATTMAAQSAEIYRRFETIARVVPEDHRSLVRDLVDQFDRLRYLAEQEMAYLDGVIHFFRTRNDTRMMVAGERLAVIAAVTLPITALASVLGMNLQAGVSWNWVPLTVTLLVMLLMSSGLLAWTRRQGWW